MKRFVVVLAVAVLVGLGAYCLSYGIARCTYCRVPDTQDPSCWMRQEFHLNDAQYAQVKQLEAAYYPHCSDMCDQIDQAHMTLKKLIMANGSMTPEVRTALKKDSAIQQQCREDMLRHFYEISEAMSRTEGRRYLQMMQAEVVEPEKTSTATVAQH